MYFLPAWMEAGGRKLVDGLKRDGLNDLGEKQASLPLVLPWRPWDRCEKQALTGTADLKPVCSGKSCAQGLYLSEDESGSLLLGQMTISVCGFWLLDCVSGKTVAEGRWDG